MQSQRIHIVGCRHSGTTLMMELMWNSFRFSGRSENEQSLFKPIPPGEECFLTKKSSDTIRIEEVFLQDPDLYVIAMIRDPRSVVTTQSESIAGKYSYGFRRWYDYSNAISRLIVHPQYVVVRYETLIRDPEVVQQQIHAKLPFLERTDNFASFPQNTKIPVAAVKSLGGVRPLDPSTVDRWRQHLPRIKQQLQRFPNLSDELIRFGYEDDRSWESIVEDIASVGEGDVESWPHYLKRSETRLRYWFRRRAYLHVRRMGLTHWLRRQIRRLRDHAA